MFKLGSQQVMRLDGIEVLVSYKDVKGYRLRIKPPADQVLLSAPYRASAAQVQQVIEQHREWIFKASQQVRARTGETLPLTDGSIVKLWGQPHQLQVTAGTSAHASLDAGMIRLRRPEGDYQAGIRALERLYRREIEPVAEQFFATWQPAIGRQPSRVRYRQMKSRWGSCNPRTGSITLNLALAEREPRSLEYVVVHELVHLLEHNHGPRFQAWMNLLLPDWRQRRRELRFPP